MFTSTGGVFPYPVVPFLPPQVEAMLLDGKDTIAKPKKRSPGPGPSGDGLSPTTGSGTARTEGSARSGTRAGVAALPADQAPAAGAAALPTLPCALPDPEAVVVR